MGRKELSFRGPGGSSRHAQGGRVGRHERRRPPRTPQPPPAPLEPQDRGHHRERRRQIELIPRLLCCVPTCAGHLPGTVPLVESKERLGRRDLRLARILAEAGTGAKLEASRQSLHGAAIAAAGLRGQARVAELSAPRQRCVRTARDLTMHRAASRTRPHRFERPGSAVAAGLASGLGDLERSTAGGLDHANAAGEDDCRADARPRSRDA